MKVVFSVTARRDLYEQASYIAQDSLNSSLRFLDTAQVSISQLSKFPELGRVYHFTNFRLKGIRVRSIPGFRKYLVFYRVLKTKVEVVRILHSSRDLQNLI